MCRRAKTTSKHRKMHDLYERQNGLCFYCKIKCQMMCKPMRDGNRFFIEEEATFEHRLPKCLGGGNDEANLVMACAFCNNVKGNGPVYPLLTPIFSHPMAYVPTQMERNSYAYS